MTRFEFWDFKKPVSSFGNLKIVSCCNKIVKIFKLKRQYKDNFCLGSKFTTLEI